MINPANEELSICQQCELLSISRSGWYYKPAPVDAEELGILERIDRMYLEHPFYGARRIVAQLQRDGIKVCRKRVRRLMRLMGIEAIYQKPKTSQPDKEHPKYPYLLKDLDITKANQVWSADITYIPMRKGFMYLIAVMDWYSRKVLSWKLSNTMDTRFCVEALEDALSRYPNPEIFNTDQGSQFTSQEWTNVLKNNGISISMDGKGRCLDNVFIERLWKSLKYEEVYLKAYETGMEARSGIGNWLLFYNQGRLHQALEYQTPDEVYGIQREAACGYGGQRCALPTFPQAQQPPQTGTETEERNLPRNGNVVEVKTEGLAA